MSRKTHKTLLWLVAVLAIIGVGAFVLSRTAVGESVKREGARLFDYEYIPNQAVEIENTEAAAGTDSIYKDFRKKFRFHYQTIGMASFADSSRMILLSDIPPHFETDSIAPIFAKFTHKTELRRHPIGYDGYTTDVVILLGNATQENCNNLIRRLNRELFFSVYKPTVTTLPAEHGRRYFVRANSDDDSANTNRLNLDYQITLEEFNTWFMEEGEGFMSLEDTTTILTVSDIFAQQAWGVYFSQEPGFVAWALPKNGDLNDTLAQSHDNAITQSIQSIRQFTLDADLILGAFADSSTLVIIGRERQSPLYELPPLQVESILLLASTTEKELSQSLDINDLMAGKMVNGKDWCPTYLSRELENTEFGDLMTLTDVLLKDWSEHGTIQESYYRYPEPGYYPFDRPLFRKLGLNELVYNWNTAGAMYAIDNVEFRNTNFEEADAPNSKFKIQNSKLNYTIYTLGRTGSLPVSYFNSQERSQSIGYRYEAQAYHYFATLGCTDLARVVQYTALYQLFIDNGISYSGDTYPSFPKNKPFLLCKPATRLLNTLKELSGEEIALLADSLSQRSFRHYLKEQVDMQLRDRGLAPVAERDGCLSPVVDIDAIYRNVQHNTQAGISRSIHEVKSMLGSLTEEQFTQLARYLAYPRGVKVRDSESYNTYLRGRRVNQLMREMGKNNLDLLGMDLGDVKNWYAAQLKGSAGRYMKTPSLIVTYNDLLTTGGHNLSSRISRVNSMTHYKRNLRVAPPEAGGEPKVASKRGTQPHMVGAPDGKTSARPAVAKPGKKQSSPQAVKHSGLQNVRARSTVISAAPRARRGL